MNSDAIEISGHNFRYWAIVSSGLIAHLGDLARGVIDRKRCAIIADGTSARLFGDRARRSLASQNFSSQLITIATGEKSKSLTQVEKICDEMISASFDRQSFVVGLGGGVIGDISGFVAAIFQRGIPHIQVPTTLLAMVDSSIGGKTAVNLRAGKNLLGVIHHPALVVCDVGALESLPPEETRQGYAEIIKHAIIRDAEMFRTLSSARASGEGSRPESLKVTERHPSSPSGTDVSARDDGLAELIRRNIRIKAAIVSVDDRETLGARALLNFGHTVGHAIERATDFKIAHGDCVSIGIVAACTISVERAGLSPTERRSVIAVLKKFGLPTELPSGIDRDKIMEAIVHDKKFLDGTIRFVVTPKIGEAHVSTEVTMDDIQDAIAEL